MPDLPDVATERTAPVVVLAMHVIGNGATQRDVPGSRRDRQEPSPRNRHGEDFLERDACLGLQYAEDQSALMNRSSGRMWSTWSLAARQLSP